MREMGPINLFLVDLNLVEDFVVVLLFFRLIEQPFRQKNFVSELHVYSEKPLSLVNIWID